MSDGAPQTGLATLGWRPFFQAQMAADEEHLQAFRVVSVQRSGISVSADIAANPVEAVLGGRWYQQAAIDRPTIGDWVLMDSQSGQIVRLLERLSLIKRLSPGSDRELQPIAANVDTLFVVTSCNDDFNPSRIERYLALALDAGVQPVVVLTKVDLTAEVDSFVDAVRTIGRDLPVEAVNALDANFLDGLRAWCPHGQTVALLGSSGVGKSTLANSLMGSQVQATGGIRADDAKGRHTTTNRSLHEVPGAGLLLDSPGMRELQVADVEEGVTAVFRDIEDLARLCRFNDCVHHGEPGCAVAEAIAKGLLDERRFRNFEKLAREEAYNRESVAERHSRVRDFSKKVKQSVKAKPSRDS